MPKDNSRLSKEKEILLFGEVDLNKLLHDVKIDFELLIEEKKASIVNRTLPVIHGDSIQLSQLFSNLISNALKFTRDNPSLTISCSVISKNEIDNSPTKLLAEEYYELTFKDNGIGFEQGYSKQILFTLSNITWKAM